MAPLTPLAHQRPAVSDVAAVAARLSDTFGDFRHHNRRNPLEELIFIVLSIQTDEAKYREAYSRLRAAFPTFTALAGATEEMLFPYVERAGLGRQRASRLRGIFSEVIRRNGNLTLARLRTLPDIDCETWLTSLPGVGLKTARCVMMYSLGRPVFPVDTHCWRIMRRLGWSPRDRDYELCTDRDMDVLQDQIPPTLRESLHVNFVSLGRRICTAAKPRCAECPIADYCRTGQQAIRLEAA